MNNDHNDLLGPDPEQAHYTETCLKDDITQLTQQLTDANTTITTLRKLCAESLEVIADIADNWIPITDKVKHLRQQLEELPHG